MVTNLLKCGRVDRAAGNDRIAGERSSRGKGAEYGPSHFDSTLEPDVADAHERLGGW